MSYAMTRRRRYRSNGRQSLGFDLFDALSVINPLTALSLWGTKTAAEEIGERMGASVTAECYNAGDEATAPLLARVMDLRVNWNPTGYYQASDVRDVVNSTLAVALSADEQIANAPRSTSDAESTIAQVRASIKKHVDAAQLYLKVSSEAMFSGIPVDAPGLKDWVLSTMRSAIHGINAAYFFQCSLTWLERALMVVQRVLDAAWTFIKGVASLAVAIGEQVAQVPTVLSSLVTVGKYGILGYAAYRVIRYLKEQHR